MTDQRKPDSEVLQRLLARHWDRLSEPEREAVAGAVAITQTDEASRERREAKRREKREAKGGEWAG